jgi:4-hydroxy-tetrahydrodipicolinate reductase
MSEQPLTVGVLGAYGKMGRVVCDAIRSQPDLVLVAELGRSDPRDPLTAATVAVDFTEPAAVLDNIQWAVERGIHIVVGTSGFDDNRLDAVATMLRDKPDVSVMIVPNFSLSAVLAMQMAVTAAKYFDSADILDIANIAKKDAPSGTALRTAQLLAGTWADGGAIEKEALNERVNIQSVRIERVFLQQKVIMGGPGESLTISFNTADRTAYMPGVLLAVRSASRCHGLTIGLEKIMDIGD